jgi:hypothetical protein
MEGGVSVKGGDKEGRKELEGEDSTGDCFLAMGREPRGAVRLVCSD